MANIFGRAFQNLQSLLGKTPEEVEAIRIEAIRNRKRAEDQQASLARLTAEARAKGAAAAQMRNERELRLQKERLETLARQERIARENADAARRQEQAAERALIRLEQTKSVARRALLLGRAEADEELFERTFGYAKPKGAKEYEDIKTGEGGLPDMQMFLRGYLYSAFASSNVQALQYDPTQSDLYVQYIKKMRWYRYRGVSRSKAEEAYMSASKGLFSWDSLRVRGTVNQSRYAVEKGAAPPPYLPLDSSAAAFAGGF